MRASQNLPPDRHIRLPADYSGRFRGYLAMGVTVAVWAGFALTIRLIETSPLTPGEVSMIRFAVPALVLLPWLPARWGALRRVKWSHAAMILIGAGIPYFLTASWGGSLSSATFVGTLIPGLVPVFVIALTALRTHRSPTGYQAVGVVFISAGVLALLAHPLVTADSTTNFGAAILIGASMLWSVYTLALRETDLDAIGCTLLLSIPSALANMVLLATGTIPGSIENIFTTASLPFVAVQGVGVGMIASLGYRYAIKSIGAPRSAVLGSLSPIVTVILALLLLDEFPTASGCVGVAIVAFGVSLANIRLRRKGIRC